MFLLGANAASAQTPAQEPQNMGPPYYDSAVQFSTGQDVVPVYEGWLRNQDGSFTMVFGYFNRNYKEELAIPTGPDNNVEPGGLDQGQPTLFAPRRQSWLLRVKVPSDWGDKELVWTLTSHGRTEKAHGKLQMEEEITERLIMSHGNLSPGLDDPHKPPSITVAPVGETSVSKPLDLTALVTDDGLPERHVPKARAEGAPGTAQTNSANAPRIGLSVTWLEYRGPAKVTLDDMGPITVSDGKAVTTVHFTEAGTYVFRATANDGELSASTNFTVNVVK